VGYAGGTTPAPTYTSIGDHTETIRMEYDPTVISYAELLQIFWADHDPTAAAYSTQYRSVILYMDDEQKRIAEESKAAEAERRGEPVLTAIEPFDGFTSAEDYHQKYRLQHHSTVMADYHAHYPDFDELVDSTAVARLNGYVSGHGSWDELEADIDAYGLSPAAREYLEALLDR